MAKGNRNRRRRNQQGGLRQPHEAQNLEEVQEAMEEVQTEVATMFSDDPVLGLADTSGIVAADEVAAGIPVILFEPGKVIRGSLPDGTNQEIQVESIIGAGFTRWRMISMMELLDDWSVRETHAGVELWDGGGIWARGRIELPDRWILEANRHGYVMAVYGPILGVRRRGEGPWGVEERKRVLKEAHRAGIVADGLVPWVPLPVPDDVPFEGPSYDAATGRCSIGLGPGGREGRWQLNVPGGPVCHGLVMGEPGTGVTNFLRILALEVICSGLFQAWLADPNGHGDLTRPFEQTADWIAKTPQDAQAMLARAVRLIEERRRAGTYGGPSPESAGVLIVLDDSQLVLAGNRAATELAETIVAEGGRWGIGLVIATRGAELAYFGGSVALRTGLSRNNVCAFGTGLALLDQLG
jgi:hypothetical protein